ncbi:hypothetical protein Tco_0977192 [Tanacetum coccineum]|uniref:Uncharacterized protein n=1 Tax=Tanacetum coccineum TaxID=301880 RepID=A0ABQ5EJD8_9ASTR
MRVWDHRPLGLFFNGSRKLLTTRKRVGPLSAHILAWRRASPRSSDHHPSFSSLSLDPSPVHSSGLDAPDQAHSGSSTRDSHHQDIHRPLGLFFNGSRKLLTTRKRVGPLSAHILAWRRASPRSSDHHPSFSSLSSDGPPSQDPYVIIVSRWRSKVASRPSSSFEFPIAPVTAPPGIRRRSAILIRPEEAIPFGRPYRTHLNGSRKLLTTRKRVGPLSAHILAWRRASPRSSDHHPSFSSLSLDSSPVHSSGLDAPDQAHSGSSTRDSSSGYSSERPLHSSSHSARPSRKRCRSLVDSVPSSTPVMGSLAPTRADLLPPRKRFRDSYSSEASIEEDTEIDPIETEVDLELGISDGDDVRDHVKIDPRDVRDDTEGYEADTSVGDTVKVGIDPMSVPIVEEEIVEPAGEDSFDSSGIRDGIVWSFEDMPIDLDDVVRDFYHHMSEVCIDRIVGIEIVQRRLEANQLIARGQRVGMIERI